MKRYKNTNIIKRNGINREFATQYYPEIPLSDNDIYKVSKVGDRLENLADKYYSDATLWFVIGNANNLGNGTLVIPAGMRIRIPDPSIVMDIYNLIDDIN